MMLVSVPPPSQRMKNRICKALPSDMGGRKEKLLCDLVVIFMSFRHKFKEKKEKEMFELGLSQ